MNYYKNDIKHCKGDTYSSAIVIEGLGQTVDSIYFTCRENLNDNAEILFQSGINNGISMVEYDAENDIRKYAVRVAPIKTRELQSGTYYYDLKVSVNGDVFTVMKGKFILEQDSTREDIEPDDPLIIIIKNSLDEINGETISVDIVEKLDYLEETKTLMKNIINDLGGDLTDTDTFRNYVDEIYNIYPKAKGEGTNIILNGTKVSKMKFEIVGEEESVDVKIQNKNLIITSLSTIKSQNTSGTWNDNVYTINGLTFTINDDFSITIGGEFNSNTAFYICDYFSILPNSYKLIGSPQGDTSNTTRLTCDIMDGNTYRISVIDYGTTASFNTSTYTNPKIKLYINIRSEYAINKTFYPQVIFSSITTTNYVEHQEENITLPLAEGEYAYSYEDVTNVIATSTIKATALKKGDE